MSKLFALTLLAALFSTAVNETPVNTPRADKGSITASDNPQIDYAAFEKQVVEVGRLREQRRITEQEFLKRSKRQGVVVLDARSREKFGQLHIRGAVNLPMPDFTEAELKKLIPSKETMVLIYCNNNFRDEPVAFPVKRVAAALNVHTFNALHSYGYTNVYELAPVLKVESTKLPFAGTRAKKTTKQPVQRLQAKGR
ncbi:MAG: rhodanese-like domain-containing protein [Planctomycetaceae bacterium]|nr:rhodanese-like domain-containing protein [Planctomycetaceae bacterium]